MPSFTIGSKAETVESMLGELETSLYSNGTDAADVCVEFTGGSTGAVFVDAVVLAANLELLL